jgi:hypothetical protein
LQLLILKILRQSKQDAGGPGKHQQSHHSKHAFE